MGLILASGSPRRRSMLRTCGIPVFSVRPSDIDESCHRGEAPVPYARRLALEKAQASLAPGHWILAADTIVHTAERMFGKPTSSAEAAEFLGQLSGRWHAVTTAWCLHWGGGRVLSGEEIFHDHTTTRVRFRSLSPVTIARYVETGESADKAGAYGIQGLGSILIDTIEGSYSNVVGLPLGPVLAALEQVGIVPSEES